MNMGTVVYFGLVPETRHYVPNPSLKKVPSKNTVFSSMCNKHFQAASGCHLAFKKESILFWDIFFHLQWHSVGLSATHRYWRTDWYKTDGRGLLVRFIKDKNDTDLQDEWSKTLALSKDWFCFMSCRLHKTSSLWNVTCVLLYLH